MEDKLIVYLDDILIYRSILEELCDQTEWCLQQLWENKLFVKLKKYKFEVTETRMLGFIVNEKGLTMEPEHIKTITNWSVPTTLTQVQEFIDFVNFYHRFIFNISGIIKPITDLTWKTTSQF